MRTDGSPPEPRHPRLVELSDALTAEDPFAAADAAGALVGGGDADLALDALASHVAQHGAEADHAALELLIETLDASGVVQRFAGSMLLDTAAVDDVAQDTLISIVQSIGSFRGAGAFTSWVYPIVKRRVADHLRRKREASPLHEELLPAERMSSLIATRATVQRSLEQLPEIYRGPVTLRDLHGLPYAEIAEQLGRSLGTVKSQVSRGRAMVAGMLGELDPLTPPGSTR